MIPGFTLLEHVLFVLLWIIIGFWICLKRDWYRDGSQSYDQSDTMIRCTLSVVFSPISLIVVFFKIFVIAKWNNKDC